MKGRWCKMHVYTYDTDHGYKIQMTRENVPCVFISCQFSFALCKFGL